MEPTFNYVFKYINMRSHIVNGGLSEVYVWLHFGDKVSGLNNCDGSFDVNFEVTMFPDAFVNGIGDKDGVLNDEDGFGEIKKGLLGNYFV